MSSSRRLNRIELIAALVATAGAAAAHVLFMKNAGSLWRDEIGTVNLAFAPTWGAFWQAMEFESYPALWPLILRGLWAMGLIESDQSLRVVGMIVGLGVLAALWVAARSVGRTAPLFAIVLVGASPVMIRWGDSLRAWGFGTLTMLLMFAAMWRMQQRPTRGRIIVAAIASLLAVQSVYYNVPLLAGLVAAVAAAGWSRRRWDRGPTIAAVGIAVISALSLLPYLPLIRRAGEWRKIGQVHVDAAVICRRAAATADLMGPWCAWLWLGLIIVALILIVRSRRRRSSIALTTAAAASTAGYALLIRHVSFPPSPWYYLVIGAMLAVVIDAAMRRRTAWRWVRLTVVIVAAVLASPNIHKAVRTRQTNLGVIAYNVAQRVTANDLIIVTPWWLGITFDRYYKGETPWCTLPEMEDHRSYRADLMVQHMQQPSPIQSVIERAEATMKRGGMVGVVGWYRIEENGERPEPLPPAPGAATGWYELTYLVNWSDQLVYHLWRHAERRIGVDIDIDTPINEDENADMMWVQGWRETPRQRDQGK